MPGRARGGAFCRPTARDCILQRRAVCDIRKAGHILVSFFVTFLSYGCDRGTDAAAAGKDRGTARILRGGKIFPDQCTSWPGGDENGDDPRMGFSGKTYNNTQTDGDTGKRGESD